MDSEHMKSAITSYLRRRRYSEPELPYRNEDSLSPIPSKQQMAVMAAVDKVVTRSNSITFSNNANYSAHVDQQYNRLMCWIGDLKVESCRDELAALLCPLFCHLYLEIVFCNQRPLAIKFLKRYFALFASREDNRELLEDLAKLASLPPNQDIDLPMFARAFRSAKYRLKLSTQSMLVLQKYLSDYGHVLILQAIQKWFDIEITDSDSQERDEDIRIETYENDSSDSSEAESIIIEDEDMKSVLDAIKAVKRNPSPLLLYLICNVNQNFRVQCSTITDSRSILAVGVDTSIKLWGLREKLKDHIPLATFFLGRSVNCEDLSKTFTFDSIDSSTTALYGHAGPVQGIAFLPNCEDPEVMLSVSQDSTMRSWTLDDYKCAAAYRGHTHGIWCLDIGSFGLSVATGSRDKTVRIWSLERNYPLRTCAGHLLDVESIQFHPNNLYLASGSADKTVRMWSVNDAKLLRLFCGHTGCIQSVAFSPDGKYLASAGEDKRIKIWDLAGGKLLKEFKGHTQAIKSVSWSRNSESVCSSSLDGSVRVWSLQRRVTEFGDPAGANDMLYSFSIGANFISVTYSKSNTILCVATD